jgi:hypothetical protein
MTVDQLIASHWAGCDVGLEETPEDYAIRHEEARMTGLRRGQTVVLRSATWVLGWHADDWLCLQRTEGAS